MGDSVHEKNPKKKKKKKAFVEIKTTTTGRENARTSYAFMEFGEGEGVRITDFDFRLFSLLLGALYNN